MEERIMTDDITQDTLDFQLIAEHTVVNTTVKLVAKIEALANLQTEDDLRSDIRKTLKSFIDADWQFSNMLRVSDNTGYERICLTASVRVSESENYNLIDRAKAVSRKGLQIIDVDADTSIPSKQISEAESDLRVELIQRASAERVKLSKAAGRNYRVHSMLFSSVGKTRQVINNPATKMAYGTGFDSSEDGTLGNAAKLTMNASVKLAVIVENDHDKQAQEWRKDFGLAATGN
jgi:hypothetical protein